MSAFLEYVQSLPEALGKLGPSTKLHVTVGNESCDLDSMVCALGHAHYLSVKHSPIDPEFISLPLFACTRADLDLRPEAVAVFEQVGVKRGCLVFLDDLKSEKLSSVGQLEITLVDHNSPTGIVAEFASKIVEVIDHHDVDPEGVVGRENVRSTIETVGSCSTLVADKLLQDGDYKVEEGVAILLLSAILLDTGNLLAEGRVTEKDRAAAEELQKLLPKSLDRQAHFKTLFTERFDISKLSTLQVLQKDFKLAKVCDKYSLGFSSVTALLSDFAKRENFGQDVSDFYHERKLDVLLLLGMYVPDPESSDKRRQILIYQPHSECSNIAPDFAESLANVLEANEGLQCVRETDEVEGFEGILLNQGNIAMSRKQILPIVTQFVNTVEKEHLLTVGVSQHPLEPTVTVVTPKGEAPADRIPEYSAKEEIEQTRTHRFVSVAGDEHVIDMTLVQPYRKIVQHAGYIGEERMAVVIISACYLPPRRLPNYKIVAQEIFYYVLSTLDKLIVDKYMIVYLHSGAPRHSMPSVNLLHRFYQLVDHRFRKQLMHLYIVHPTFLVKAIFTLARPFISTKFWRKVKFVPTLEDLNTHVALDDDLIPAPVLDADKAIMARRPTHEKYQAQDTTEDQK